MSKIEEMACQYSNNIESNYDIDMFDRGDIMDAYEDGANAVIKEIEMELSALTFEDYVIHSQRCKKVIEEIYLKVQELKGQK